MSIKNLPMLNYLTAQTSVHAALLAEIRVVKEESINNQLEAYKNELQEEFQKALEDFRDLQKNLESPNLLDAQNVTSETEVSEEAFIENLQLINKEKIETLSNTLYKDLELQLRILNQRTGCELVREYCGKLKLDRLSSTY